MRVEVRSSSPGRNVPPAVLIERVSVREVSRAYRAFERRALVMFGGGTLSGSAGGGRDVDSVGRGAPGQRVGEGHHLGGCRDETLPQDGEECLVGCVVG